MEIESHKYGAVFGEGNSERLHQIVLAGKDPAKLAKISPAFIIIDLTWRCNYKCSLCIDKNIVNVEKKDLPVPLIEDIFDYSKKNGVRGIMTMGGEVFFYKKGITKALEKSIEHQIPVKTVSNGSFLGQYVDLAVEAYKIPGSMLRVSVNATRENYLTQTGRTQGIGLDDVFDSIKQITSRGTPVYVSTVYFPEDSRRHGSVPNIKDLGEIMGYCEEAGVKTQILIPARDPETRAGYRRNDEEKEIMKELVERAHENGSHGRTGLGDEAVSSRKICEQKLDFDPCCPSGFMFTLIGSDGQIYKCSDNRGKDSMVLGRINEPGDFERFWHSTKRVELQKCTHCPNQGCGRYVENCLIDGAINLYYNKGVILLDYMGHAVEDGIFI